MNTKIKKVLVLGSGALKIGEAGEFDYSGAQAIKALKAEGITVILVNPNIATNQTSAGVANRVYFLPVTPPFVAGVIKKERPDGIMLGFGGQTALNCGVALHDQGVLTRYGVAVLGTSIQAIKDTEDRARFTKRLREINITVPESRAVYSMAEALTAAQRIGYPVMVRNAFALGGRGSGVARSPEQLRQLIKKSFAIGRQALIEEYVGGWKEIEYEIVRDCQGNIISVCNMENVDPMGIHTGESIVVAPSQTLDNTQFQLLRDVAFRVINHLGIVGECNIQFALDPRSNQYRVIEVNARLSRSSALASKATGYPLAFVAAKLAVGYTLPLLKNPFNQTTTACFEPALDYVVVKMPRWDLKKFKKVSIVIDSEMKSVGEVMSIGRTFEEALQKAVRMINGDVDGLDENGIRSHTEISWLVKHPTPDRIFAIGAALRRGITIKRLHHMCRIDPWFLQRLKNIIDFEQTLKRRQLSPVTLRQAKLLGFSDKRISFLCRTSERRVRSLRQRWHITPVVKQIDTLAAEYPTATNYLYLTYHGTKHDIAFSARRPIIVLGSGAYCIGSSVEFDWCSVNAIQTLRRLHVKTIMINCNPETVSTDFDECDALYFEELTLERILDIYELEKPRGIIVSMGGQIPNNLAMPLYRAGVKIIGTGAVHIDTAEDRNKFSRLLDQLHIDQPEWRECVSVADAVAFAKRVEYPVLIRPSYVLSGAAMSIAFNQKDLHRYLIKAAEVNRSHPVVVSKFISHAKEIEFDAVANRGTLTHWYISEHVENAGVHSGDATILFPAQHLHLETIRKIHQAGQNIAAALHITGPFNIQFLAKEDHIKVIECNIRASRTLPFISKIANMNLVSASIMAMLGQKKLVAQRPLPRHFVGVKAPQFSFSRLSGADPILTVEMSSTGEVVGLGTTISEAILKAMLASGFNVPKKNILLSLGGEENKIDFLPYARLLGQSGFRLFATPRTAHFLRRHHVSVQSMYKISQKKTPNIQNYIENKKIDLLINTSDEEFVSQIMDDYLMRRLAVDFNIPLITNIQLAITIVEAFCKMKFSSLAIKAWDEYLEFA